MRTIGGTVAGDLDRYSSRVIRTSFSGKRLLLFTAGLLFLSAVGIALRLSPDASRIDLSTGDDWVSYHRLAVDIVQHGVWLRSVDHAYGTPGGFLYSYFVAAVYAVRGFDARVVYVLHGILIAAALVIFFVAGRRYLSPTAALLYLLLTARILYTDLYREIAVRLLSENLVVFLIAISTWLLLESWERRSTLLFGVAGAVLGLTMLARLSLELVPFGMAMVILLASMRNFRRGLLQAGTLVASALLVFSFLPIRNAIVTGGFVIASGEQMSLLPNFRDPATLMLVVKRTLYCAGILPGGVNMDGAGYVLAAHFLIPTAAAVGYVVYAILRRRIAFVDGVAIAWIVVSYGPFIALPALGGYGMRFQWPTEPLLLFLACRLFDVFLKWLRASGRQAATTVSGDLRVPAQ